MLCAIDTHFRCRTMHGPYNNVDTEKDNSRLEQLKRATPSALQMGYVTFKGGVVLQMPDNDLANDWIMPEGTGDGGGVNLVDELVRSIPRYTFPCYFVLCKQTGAERRVFLEIGTVDTTRPF